VSWPERSHTLPDGREVRAVYEGEPVGWVVHIVGEEDRPVASRDIRHALVDLLEPGDGGRPAWFRDAAEDLAARDTPLGRRHPCACCGYLTLPEAPTGTFFICPVCRWEDDNIQFHDPDYEGGANKLSLNQARRDFREGGTSDPRRGPVRPPLREEQP
jgi:hypothetical protein